MSDGNRILLLHLDVDEGRVVIARNNPDNARYVVVAARDHDLDAAALVFLGCAAVGAETVGALRYKGPVYATSPDVSGDGTPAGVHGPRPDGPGFGATVLRSGPLSFQGDPVVRYLPELRRIILGEA
ncbi:hypothetical protein [Streptomyces sp. NPDC001070]